MKKVFLIALAILPLLIQAQEKKDPPKSEIKFSGFVKSDFFWDTRQNSSIREGHFLLYPLAIFKDSVGKDINDVPNFNFLSIQSRLSGKITGPDAFGAKTSGVIEADFFGNAGTGLDDVNGFRLRHGFAKLSWPKTELLFGQYWHPLFIAESFPGVISFNTGAPFQPFSRNPQVRITHKINDFKLIAAICSQRDFTSMGGSTLIRNSAIPEAQVQFQYAEKNDSLKTEMIAGIGGGYKILRPRLVSTVGTKIYKIDETVGSFSTTVFFKYKIPVITIKLQGVYGQNLADLLMLGGYAIDTISDVTTGKLKYAPSNTMSAWLDINTNGEKIQFGIFAGYTENLGLDNALGFKKNVNIINALKSTERAYDIKSVLRVTPRILFIAGKFQFTGEVEFTMAAYATKTNNETNISSKGVVTGSENVSNIRALFAVIYNF